jgi:L-ectoine synthase
MIVRTLNDARQTARRVVTENWESTRLILKADGMGFSFHITTIYAGSRNPMCYRNHLESVYCIAGRGELESAVDGKRYHITPGTLYALDKHDPHTLIAHTDLLLACVFNPPVTGREVHDETGAYPADDKASAIETE